MATSLEFGSLSTSGTTPRLSGTSSQLDTESLIEALTEAKRLPALRLENQITENESRLAAFTDLRALLSEVQASVAGGRNPPGVLGQDDNIFENKEAFFTSSSSVSPTELLGVSASNQAATGSYEITVEQLATTRKFSSAATTAADQTLADAFNAGAAFNQTITIGLAGSGSNASIDVDGSMDIYELSAAINAQSADAGVQASVLKVSDSDFRLVVTATTTGTEVTLGGDAATLDLLGFSADGGASFENSLQIPELAQLEIDNVTITRSTNQITDAIDGLTFNLFKADLGTTVKVDVEPALNDVKSTVTRFVDAYNEFRSFVEQQSAISETGEISEDSILFGNSTLRALERVVTDNVGTGVDGLDVDALRSLSAIGINLDAGNKLSIDEAKFDDLLLNDLDSVRDVLEFRFTSSSTDLEVFSRGNTLGDTDFTVDIVDSDNDGVIESATIDGIAVDIDGQFIKGQDGTIYEGLELFWSGTGSTSITASATTGIAERLFTNLEGALDEVDGTLTLAVDNLETLNDRYRVDITNIDERVDSYRTQLIEKYSALEAALSLAESMLNQIRATSAALSGENN